MPSGYSSSGQTTVGRSIHHVGIEPLESGEQAAQQSYLDNHIFIELIQPVFVEEKGIKGFESIADFLG